MARRVLTAAGIAALLCAGITGLAKGRDQAATPETATLRLAVRHLVVPVPQSRTLRLDNWFYETAAGRVMLPPSLMAGAGSDGRIGASAVMPDGRVIRASAQPQGDNWNVSITAEPSTGIRRWGVSIDSPADEFLTGIMERVVDGPQQASWAPARTEALDLRGQKIEMIIKPTTSVYAPFYLSSRNYGLLVKGTWPGAFDFAATDTARVSFNFEGPSFAFKIFTGANPMAIVQAHAMEVGPSILPPKWAFRPWRWRDEHRHRTEYYDKTPVTGPFNSEVMEDVLMMKAFGIPNGVYWIDRPWGTGTPWGYDDFEIDPVRLPNFGPMVKWLNSQDMQMLLWIAPFFQGKMAEEATARGYTLKDQVRPANGNNYPMVDLSNPAAKKYWQDGIKKLLDLGVAAFKLDRAEENIPDDGPTPIADGRSIREQRNDYPVMYVKAVHDVVKAHRGDDFLVMPRAAYTGSSKYGVFWGGDIGGTEGGLRASIIAMQRSAVMGYPVWGADTCGYNDQRLEQDACGRWIAWSAFNPIMEIGPTRNLGFWNLPREPAYDAELIALWRTYARLHDRLVDYSYAQARLATRTGTPIVRPLFLVEPAAKAAWTNWWTYLYGPDLLVSPVWKQGQRTQEVYLPTGAQWRDVWRGTVHKGGQTITVPSEVHELPLFVRVGANLPIGDLAKEHVESRAIAAKRPNLAALEAEVKAWFAKK